MLPRYLSNILRGIGIVILVSLAARGLGVNAAELRLKALDEKVSESMSRVDAISVHLEANISKLSESAASCNAVPSSIDAVKSAIVELKAIHKHLNGEG
jgi:DNA-binding FrmR family transcriptional regulator